MTAHLRAIGVLMALCLVAALAGAMSGCGGGNAPGALNTSSVHTPHVTGHAGQIKLNLNDPTAPVNGSAIRNWRDSGSLTDFNTPIGPVATNPVRSASMAGDLAELDAMPVPSGADPRVWAQLKSLFRRMLLSGAIKAVSSPPTSNLSKVDDLAATGDTTSGTFTWTYRSQGDYNQDRLVNAQDLAPLGIHWEKTPASADWNIARAADGDANGLVAIGDLSPIGANFDKDTAGYHLQYSADGTTGWAQVADAPWVESAITDGLRVFTHILAPAQAGFYRVLPYDLANVEGIAGDALQFPTTVGNPPVAVLTATPSSGDPPLNVTFDGGGSSDPDAGDFITKYEFDFGDPAGTWVDNDTGSSLSHTYNAVGIYTAMLRVTDNNGNTDTDSKQITVGTQPDLFTQALTGVTLAATDLNFSYITEPITFGDAVTNYGWDVATFDNGVDPPFGVPGSRFGAYTGYWHDDHTQLPVWSQGFTDSVDAAGNIESLIKSANDKFFEGTSRQTYGPWAANLPVPGTDYTPAPTDPLATAVINLINNNGGSADAPAITTDGADVPLGLQNVLSDVLQAADAAGVAIQASKTASLGAYTPPVPPATPPTIWEIAFDHSGTFRMPITPAYLWSFLLFGLNSEDGGATWIVNNRPLCDVLDYPTYAQAAINLAHALDQANALLSSGTVTGTFSFDQVTPIGRILINSGGGDTTYTQTEDPVDATGYYLLLCDVDGNDTYNCNAGANGNMFNPVSICLDLAGNDTYSMLDDPTVPVDEPLGDDLHSQQGAGRWGVGYLVDYAGNDQYTTSQAGQGFGVVGWGLLYDKAGSDTYEGVDFVQGAALCGVGILCDEVGIDSYHCGGSAQGYGDIWGIGLLSDKGSDADTYFAEWDTTHTPAWFAYAQGAARGFLGLDAETVTMPINFDGGIGALVDSGGDDTFTSFARSQGCGYNWSTGILDDRAGNDTYETDALGQGSALLFGTGIFMDRAGNDKYNSAQATRGFPLENYTLGGCVNRSLAWFLDGGGSDEYTTQSFGLGTGAINSFAYFCDMGVGADNYSIPLNADDNQKSLGRGYLDPDLTIADGATNEENTTFGLFIDCGGVDTYDAKYADIPTGSIPNVSAGDDTGWFRFGYTNDVPNQFRLMEFGTGLDGSGIVGFEFP